MIHRVVAITHGNNVPKNPGARDENRPLSDIGREQASHRRFLVGVKERHFRLCLHAPLQQARETALGMLGNLPSILVPLTQLSIPQDEKSTDLRKKLEQLCERCGQSSLRTYYEQPEGELLRGFGQRAWVALTREIFAYHSPETLVVGCKVLLNATIFAGQAQPDDSVLDLILGECQGVEFTLDLAGKIKELKVLVNPEEVEIEAMTA